MRSTLVIAVMGPEPHVGPPLPLPLPLVGVHGDQKVKRVQNRKLRGADKLKK